MARAAKKKPDWPRDTFQINETNTTQREKLKINLDTLGKELTRWISNIGTKEITIDMQRNEKVHSDLYIEARGAPTKQYSN